jgi:Leucine-rich repeat (LRR) protein
MTTCGNPPTQAPVTEPDISAFEVLSKLYDATTGISWRRKDHWKQSSISVCEWYGVTCSIDGVEQVEDIVLSSNNLDGTVPREIFQLPYLKSLVLDSNFISMQDLGRIFDAPRLQILDLSNTAITTVVGIGKARALQELHIKSNDLKGILPVEIFDIVTLEQLDFDFCAFSGTLDSRIGQLTNLKFIGGDKNRLSGTLPKEMDELTNLVTMKLGRNSFTGSIPSSLNLLASLTVLDLSDQTEHGGPGLSGKLPALDGMKRLTQLMLKSNAITGAIPANFLQGVNPDVFEYADLSSNAIIGSIPSSLAILSHVHLQDNLITGVATEMCAESRGAIYKAFGCNAVLCPPKTYSPHGRQESEAVSCMVCQQATLWGTTSCPPKYNTGGNTVKPKISERDVLVKFYESCDGDSWNENQNWMSTASICTWTGIQCTDGSKDGGIEAIELGGNNIVGSPPTELFTLPSLTSLALYSNPLHLIDFTGIEFATNLKELLLDATGISSVAGLDRAPSLEILNLRFNQIKGALPSEIASLTTLHTLTMAYNEMTGRLPLFLEDLTNLKSLLLSSNLLSGSLSGVNFPASLRRLDLSQNSFTGPVPDSFLSLVHFQAQLEIDLSGNAFTGSLPTDLTRFNALSFYASDTKITKVDSQLCSMKNWNNGDVGKYGCDAILCPAGHSGPKGRHSAAGECRKCPNTGSEFMGSTTCGLTSSVNGHALPRLAIVASLLLVAFST